MQCIFKRRDIRPITRVGIIEKIQTNLNKIDTTLPSSSPSSTSKSASLVISSVSHLLPTSRSKSLTLRWSATSPLSHHRLRMLHECHGVHGRRIQTLRHHARQHALHNVGGHLGHARHGRHPRWWTAGCRSRWRRTTRHRGKPHTHERLHVIQLLFLLAHLASDFLLLQYVAGPCKLVESVVEIIRNVGPRPPPWFIVGREIIVHIRRQ